MELNEALTGQERAWNERELVRRQYRSWYRMINRRLAVISGPTVELGSGIGKFLEAKPDAVLTDIEPTRWTANVVDAQRLPYEDQVVANLVLLDVFHHVSDPAAFLDEAQRVLAPGGRIVIVDPYCSTLSTPLYRRFHHERTDLSAPAFECDSSVAEAPLESNQARATLIFYRHRNEFAKRWPKLQFVERKRFAFLVYPLSGGFTRPPMLPTVLYRPLQLAEGLLKPIARLCAFRCLVVLERR